MSFTLRQLRAFEQVARTRSFTLAAQQLNLTQSAVSMLVRQLEQSLGLPLFDRLGRQVHLTEAGREMLPVVARILTDMRQIEEGVDDLRALRRGRLRLAVPQMLAAVWLPDLLARFRARYPDVLIDVVDTTGDRIVQAVARDEAELGIGPRRPLAQGIAARHLWTEPIHLVCPTGTGTGTGAAPPPAAWGDVVNENWILYSDEFMLHLEQSIWAPLKMRLPQVMRVRYLPTVLALIGRGQGVTAAPRYAARLAPVFDVQFIPMTDPPLVRDFMLYTRDGFALSASAQAFCAMIEPPKPLDH
ncbi:MAG: LysR family transcriptional regulator [Pararhodobacter sp.]|nr:LysR family transcriptional regulator [Pararhodobacter sp.]